MKQPIKPKTFKHVKKLKDGNIYGIDYLLKSERHGLNDYSEVIRAIILKIDEIIEALNETAD